MTKQIIGICGWKSAGKDTIGNWLTENKGFTKDSFAKSLKNITAALFGWDRKLLEGDTPESRQWRETPDHWWEQHLDWPNHKGSKISPRFTPRFALQYLGTEIFRDCLHPDIWVLSLKRRLLNKDKVVITDCRFVNELQMIKELGGILVWVNVVHCLIGTTKLFILSPPIARISCVLQ